MCCAREARDKMGKRMVERLGEEGVLDAVGGVCRAGAVRIGIGYWY